MLRWTMGKAEIDWWWSFLNQSHAVLYWQVFLVSLPLSFLEGDSIAEGHSAPSTLMGRHEILIGLGLLTVASLGCDIVRYCFWACLLIGRACPVCRMWFDRVRAKHYQILNTRQAQPIRKQRASQPNEATAPNWRHSREKMPKYVTNQFSPFSHDLLSFFSGSRRL